LILDLGLFRIQFRQVSMYIIKISFLNMAILTFFTQVRRNGKQFLIH
jgi:hypothetical protein